MFGNDIRQHGQLADKTQPGSPCLGDICHVIIYGYHTWKLNHRDSVMTTIEHEILSDVG